MHFFIDVPASSVAVVIYVIMLYFDSLDGIIHENSDTKTKNLEIIHLTPVTSPW